MDIFSISSIDLDLLKFPHPSQSTKLLLLNICMQLSHDALHFLPHGEKMVNYVFVKRWFIVVDENYYFVVAFMRLGN